MLRRDRFLVQDIMTRKVVATSPDSPVYSVIGYLRQYHGIPVIDRERNVVGILTQQDLIEKGFKVDLSPAVLLGATFPFLSRIFGRGKEDFESLKKQKVKNLMNPDPLVVHPDTAVKEVADIFRAHHRVNPIPVVDRSGKLGGIISRADVLGLTGRRFLPRYILLRYRAFLRMSIFSSPDDIERPYHKIINLVLKIVGIGFVVIGFLFIYDAAAQYYTRIESIPPADVLFVDVIVEGLLGIGLVLIGIFISTILMIRYIAFTLPDRIYLRLTAPGEERKDIT